MASIWSIRADCGDGNWTVEVHLADLGAFDASCVDGKETHNEVELGNQIVGDGSVEATSSSNATCGTTGVRDSIFKLECAHETVYSDGFDTEADVDGEIEEDDGADSD